MKKGEKDCFGFVDCSLIETLASLREKIKQDGIYFKDSFSFLFKKTPATSIQEQKKLVKDFVENINNQHTIFIRKIPNVIEINTNSDYL